MSFIRIFSHFPPSPGGRECGWERGARGVRAPLVAVLLLLAARLLSAQPTGKAMDPTVPFPDLDALDPEVAEQLGAGQRQLFQILATPAADARARARAFGDLGKLYQTYALLEPAEACYRNAARLDGTDFRWPHYLGSVLQQASRLDEATAAYEKALALSPNDVPALVYLAEIARLQGRTGEAEERLRRALAADPASTAAKALLGQAALDRRDYAAAVKLLETALAEAPTAGRLHFLLSRAYQGLGDKARADEHLAKVGPVGVRPADPLLDELDKLRSGEKAHLIRGKTAFDNGRFAEAADEYRRALAARPESVEARVNLAAALVQTGDLPAAVAALREALQRDSANATAHFNLGTLLALQGPSEEAREHLAAAVAALPKDAEARRSLARVLRDAGRLEEALAEYGKSLELDPASEAARLGEAETLVRMGRYGPARERLEEGLRLLPRSGLLALGLARLLAACPDRAQRDGARALELAMAVWQAQPSAVHAAVVAMASAEKGDCGEAARWQRIAIEEAGRTGPADALPGMKEALAVYERGAPCRP